MMMIKIKLIFHGSLKKYNDNHSEINMTLPEGTTVGGLIGKITVPKEEIAFVALNGSRSSLTQILKEADEVKLFQIVGGG